MPKHIFATVALFLSFVLTADARIVREIGYDELFGKSDLIVVAHPVTRTTDTAERTVFPDVSRTYANGKSSKIPAIGVETVFEISWIIKGRSANKTFTLHHYRESQPPRMDVDGLLLVSFDPSDAGRRRDILLFLSKEPDGRYAPYGGQTDPGLRSINALETPP